MKCHGADGTGNKARDRLPEIPDFTNVSWQARRTDARLLESILDGKGEDMPPVRGKISEQQARGLVAFVRAFAPTPGKPEQAEQEGPGLDELPEAVPPRGFFAKLIRWLGKFHPPAVHFPIALLTAAAVAELLRMATGKPAFDAITRYCIWFGTLTAVIAGALGWCAGGFRLTDPSWVLMTHRWLGTSTVACAGLVLLLSEASRCPDRRRTRMSFRVALLVARGTRIGHRVLWRRGGLRPQSLHLAAISIGLLPRENLSKHATVSERMRSHSESGNNGFFGGFL